MSENERLKEIQKRLNFTSQAKFAEALGIKQGSLSDIYRSKNGIKVSDSIKFRLIKDYSINIDWLETGKGQMIDKGASIDNSNSTAENSVLGNKIKGKNISISNNDISKMIELHKDLTESLKISQSQLSESQSQISTLLEILKNK